MVGIVCNMFAKKNEQECPLGLDGWHIEELSTLSNMLAEVCILLSCLAHANNHILAEAITDKFAKNNAKYPVELAKGSSAKYTVYTDTINKTSVIKQANSTTKYLLSIILAGTIGFILGRKIS